MERSRFPLLLAVGALVIASLACGSSNTGEKTGSAATAEQPSATNTTVATETYATGDIVKVENHTITLNSTVVNNGVLIANFSVKNSGSGELAVSSLVSFEAKDSEGSKLEQSLFDCPSGSLDGKVLAGDNLKGNICWTLPVGASGVRIYYRANPFSSGAVVWAIDAESTASTVSADLGARLFAQPVIEANPGCHMCHSLDGSALVGPSMSGIRTRAAIEVPSEAAEMYIIKSITDPNAHIVEGYAAGVMPSYKSMLSDRQLDDLVAYLLSLK